MALINGKANIMNTRNTIIPCLIGVVCLNISKGNNQIDSAVGTKIFHTKGSLGMHTNSESEDTDIDNPLPDSQGKLPAIVNFAEGERRQSAMPVEGEKLEAGLKPLQQYQLAIEDEPQLEMRTDRQSEDTDIDNELADSLVKPQAIDDIAKVESGLTAMAADVDKMEAKMKELQLYQLAMAEKTQISNGQDLPTEISEQIDNALGLPSNTAEVPITMDNGAAALPAALRREADTDGVEEQLQNCCLEMAKATNRAKQVTGPGLLAVIHRLELARLIEKAQPLMDRYEELQQPHSAPEPQKKKTKRTKKSRKR